MHRHVIWAPTTLSGPHPPIAEMANNTQTLGKCKRQDNENLEESKRKRIKVENETTESDKQHNQGMLKDGSIFSLNSQSNHCAITYDQLRELINYVASTEERTPPSWCQIQGQNQTKVAVMVLHGVSQMHFYRYYLHFKQLRKRFKRRFSMPPPPEDFLRRIFEIENSPSCGCDGSGEGAAPESCGSPVVNGHSLAAESESCRSPAFANHPIIIKYGRKKQGLSKYLLSVEERIQNGFPVVGVRGYEGFLWSGCTTEVTDSSPLFGLDCEMCLTRNGRELTRVSLVNAKGCCLMDELVKPSNPILNYLTKFSGITWEMLAPVKTKLKDIQIRIKKILPPDAVLVGHSLNNDLKALQMIYPYVLDTSLLFVGDSGRKFKLKILVKNILGREIQSKEMSGHDPSEDAEGALQLAQYFINHGPEKIALMSLENFEPQQPLEDVITAQPEARSQRKSLPKQMCTGDRKAVLLGTKKAMELMAHQGAWHKIECETDKEVVQCARINTTAAILSLIHFTSYADYTESDLHMEINVGRQHEKMKQMLSEMCTVYAGPVCKDFCLKSVKRAFRRCGSIRSFSVTTETYQPYVRIQYEVPESALVAVETLNGSIVAERPIKVQRPMGEKSLDCDTILKKLERDVTNQAVIYVAGIRQSLSMEDLTAKFSEFGHIEAVISVVNKTNAKNKDCFIKYGNPESALKAQATMNGTEMKESKLNVQRALTPYHLQTWAAQGSYLAVSPSGAADTLQLSSQSSGSTTEELSQCEQEVKNVLRTLDRRVGRLVRGISSDTLCIILLPGINSDPCSVPGLCLF